MSANAKETHRPAGRHTATQLVCGELFATWIQTGGIFEALETLELNVIWVLPITLTI